ncbi:OFA family MFS transporter [Desulfosporosinus sp.]|uniref:L-lactate MFS transporter n=1 Tax=Desulfosporosinus sp. TaxID=157907 RepID=UPI0025C44EC4|nr:OFA family MFS transporter [Desulfosporosinus sp.]MBC2726203.1 OFA family MFS transporter [Desulfosporosinus sp.]
MIQTTVQNKAFISSWRWVYVVLGNLVMMCLGTVYAWSVFRIPVEKTFGIGATQSGLPYMISLAFYALFMMISGYFYNRYSPRAIMTTGVFLIALGWILSAYAPNIYILTLTYGVLIGAGVGIAYGVPLAVVAKWFPDKKGLAVGLVLIGFGLSPLITAPLARMFIEMYGISFTFMILGIAFGVLLPVLTLAFRYPKESGSESNLLPDTKDRKPKDIPSDQMLKTRSFKGLYLNFLIGAMIGLMLIGMTGKIGIEYMGLSSRSIAFWMSLFAIFNGLGRPVFGWLTDRLSYPKAATLSYCMIAFAALLMLFAREGQPLLFGVAFSIFWFNLGGWLAIAPTSTLALFGALNYSRNYGIVFTAYGIGAIAGVLGSGYLLDRLGSYQVVFYLVLALCLAGTLIASKQVPLSNRKPQSPGKDSLTLSTGK